MATTVNLGLTTLVSNQSNADITINNNSSILDGAVHIAAISTTLTSPPAASDGSIYIVGQNATGAWDNYDYYIAYYNQGWIFIPPSNGWLAYDISTSSIIVFNGLNWIAASQGTVFTAEAFRIVKNADSTAKIYFDISEVPTSTTNYIKVPNSNYILNKQNLSASTAPTINDDSGDGYSVGSIWINTTGDKSYICIDSTVSNAIWREIAGATGAGDVIGPTTTIDNEVTRYSGITGELLDNSNVFISDTKELYGQHVLVVDKVTNYTLTASDSGKFITVTSSSPLTITLPETITETIAKGFHCTITRYGTGTVTIDKQGSDIIYGKGNYTTIYPQYGTIHVVKLINGTPNTWFLYGDLGS
jgi:hypothetical protein